jgi:UPF0755 protein
VNTTGRLWISALVLATLLAAAAVTAYVFWAGDQPVRRGLDVFLIEPGSGVSQVARDLRSAGVIDERWTITAWAYLQDQTRAVRAGEYRIDAGLTIKQLLDKFVRGEVIRHAVTFIEGWNFAQVRSALAALPRVRHTLGELPAREIMAQLGQESEHPEGRFFPDTYTYITGDADLDILSRAYQRMKQVLEEEWVDRAQGLILTSPDEALTLASIIEKETGLASERELISAVFHNRLKLAMRLQADPTVIYGLGDGFDGNLTRKHLRTDHEYNTYTRRGLTPTPIAMPGRGAIRAALHPADSKALYFVARGDGSHEFSATLEAHNRAVIRYQLGGEQRPFSSHKQR